MRKTPAKASIASEVSNGRRKWRLPRSKLYMKMIALVDAVAGTQKLRHHLFQYLWLQWRIRVGQDVSRFAL